MMTEKGKESQEHKQFLKDEKKKDRTAKRNVEPKPKSRPPVLV